MAIISFFLLGTVCLMFAPEVSSMECNVGGFSISCPTILDDKDKVFCCDSSAQNFQYCCDVEDFMKTNSGMIAGLVIGVVVILIIIILCCCCFCSCCCLARRRVQRGHVLYGPVTSAPVVTSPSYQVVHPPPVTTPSYQVVHPPPVTQAYSPPPYNPNYSAGQPPLNPHFK